jgi:UDP-N-acetylglucosamine 2-epimerase (non-hydrolysing)
MPLNTPPKKIKILNIVGTRPNFIKIAPLIKEYENYPAIEALLVHTGQHHSKNMSDIFFKDLELKRPRYSLNIVNKTTRSKQIAEITKRFKKVCLREKPNLILVVGDVNSTVACALVARELGIRIVHVEAGLRSFDRTMPEEINRIRTDTVSSFLFISEASGLKHLEEEGFPAERYSLVGNVMIDSLLLFKKKINKIKSYRNYNLKKKSYTVLTLHRPGNVDSKKKLERILEAIEEMQKKIPIIMPLHPRTRNSFRKFNLFRKIKQMKNLTITKPLGYIDFMSLVANSKIVVTDSGGIQEETTFLGIPCITLRNNTERPVTVERGTNVLVGTNKEKIMRTFDKALNGKWQKGEIPEFWDGRTAKRIVNKILEIFYFIF